MKTAMIALLFWSACGDVGDGYDAGVPPENVLWAIRCDTECDGVPGYAVVNEWCDSYALTHDEMSAYVTETCVVAIDNDCATSTCVCRAVHDVDDEGIVVSCQEVSSYP